MESSAGGICSECGVGTIVWVRRRNGSWWPGRILGSDELSVSHLMSPRSGTPVKLLGREDASVDWYNLEKSKRVKAFRCGEFDACIERAEAYQGTPTKKREKYARREDAILHALELEKKHVGLQQQKFVTTSHLIKNKNDVNHRSEPSTICSPESYTRHDEHIVHRNMPLHKPHNISTKTNFSLKEETSNDCSYGKNKRNKQFRWEDDNSEAMPRMRGLQDFGLRTTNSKRKLSQFISWKKSKKPSDNEFSSECILGDAVLASSNKSSVSVKRKRSQSRLAEESLLKKRDRRRTLVQVLQSSAKLASHLLPCSHNDVAISMPREEKMLSICRAKRSRCVYLPQDSDETPEHDSDPALANQFRESKFVGGDTNAVEGYISSGLIEANDSDSSEAGDLDPNMVEVANMLADTAHLLLPGSNDCEPFEFQLPDKFRTLNDDDVPHSGLISQLQDHITDSSAEVGVSKWHLKGKRNTRNTGKRPMDSGDGNLHSTEFCNGSMNENTYENEGSGLNFERAELSDDRALSWGTHPKRKSFYNCDEGDLIDKDLADNLLNTYDDWRNPLSFEVTKDDRQSRNSCCQNDSVWEVDDEPSNLTHSTFWEEPVEQFHHPVYASHIGNEMEPLLVDVDIKVENNFQGEHVPLVSLMSRLNGKAIVGHPVQIEILESDSTVHLVSKFNAMTDETGAPPPTWRTGRRTAMQRVPRVNPSTNAVDDEDPFFVEFSDHGSKPTPKQVYSRCIDHRVRLAKKSGSGAHQSPSKKLQKKNSKRMSSLSQKTRTLSSFVSSDKLGDGSSGIELARSNDMLEGLIKEGSVPLVACIPVKVVFSRLLEAVGRPSSASVHRSTMNDPIVRDIL